MMLMKKKPKTKNHKTKKKTKYKTKHLTTHFDFNIQRESFEGFNTVYRWLMCSHFTGGGCH